MVCRYPCTTMIWCDMPWAVSFWVLVEKAGMPLALCKTNNARTSAPTCCLVVLVGCNRWSYTPDPDSDFRMLPGRDKEKPADWFTTWDHQPELTPPHPNSLPHPLILEPFRGRWSQEEVARGSNTYLVFPKIYLSDIDHEFYAFPISMILPHIWTLLLEFSRGRWSQKEAPMETRDPSIPHPGARGTRLGFTVVSWYIESRIRVLKYMTTERSVSLSQEFLFS